MSEYMKTIMSIGDAFQAIGETESDHNLVMTILFGLFKEYRGFGGSLNIHGQKNLPLNNFAYS